MKYATPAAFRAALETRLNTFAHQGGRPVARSRKLVAFTRLLARLGDVDENSWTLKGGFALELRIGERARATRDIDLDWRTSLDDAYTVLTTAGLLDLGDYFSFEIERASKGDLTAGGVRFRADAFIGGRLFEQLLIDVAVNQRSPLSLGRLETPDLLGFAGLSPTTVPAVPLEQHFADKFHAYTRTFGDGHRSSRAKDLIDMVLIIELVDFDPACLRTELVRVFVERGTHLLPEKVPEPPRDWVRSYTTLAEEVGIDQDPTQGFVTLAEFLNPVLVA